MIGDKHIFAIEYAFVDDDEHETEIELYINDENILAFERNGECLTTRWNLDELAEWLRRFIDHMDDDPYPVNSEGQFAAQKDVSARNFDSDDID